VSKRPAISAPFAVDFALLCDYASSDASGKNIFAGVYASDIVFGSEPTTWPTIFLVTSIMPIAQTFDFEIRLVRPTGQALIQLIGHYEAQSPPTETSRVVGVVQLPPVRFTGFGMYHIEALAADSKRSLFHRAIRVLEGTPTEQHATVSVQFKVDAEL
jgi:hypothetical protein